MKPLVSAIHRKLSRTGENKRRFDLISGEQRQLQRREMVMEEERIERPDEKTLEPSLTWDGGYRLSAYAPSWGLLVNSRPPAYTLRLTMVRAQSRCTRCGSSSELSAVKGRQRGAKRCKGRAYRC